MKSRTVETMVTIIFGILLIIVACGFLLGYFSIVDRSITIPTTAKNNVLNVTVPSYDFSHSGYSLKISDDLANDLRSAYVDNGVPFREYFACISGSISQWNISLNNILVDSFSLGTNISSGKTMFCPTIAQIHSHPEGLCHKAVADTEHFKSQAKYGVSLFIIQCSEHKLIIYEQSDLSRGYTFEI